MSNSWIEVERDSAPDSGSDGTGSDGTGPGGTGPGPAEPERPAAGRAVEPVREPSHRLGDGEPDKVTRKAPAGRLLQRWIVEQVRELELLDPAARQAGEGGVHGMRKACRRLRAALATYGPLVDRDRTDPLRRELRWLARSLGRARDDEVVAARIVRMLDEEPDHGDVGPARQVLEHYARARASADYAHVTALLDSQRYLDLRLALHELVAAPPWTAVAEGAARDVLPGRVRQEWKRVRRRHRWAEDPHELRKAVKRLRYAYEVLEPAWGTRVEQQLKAAQELTELLGDRQDTLVAREWLLALASEDYPGRESAFAFGRLHALEERREADLLVDAGKAWRELKKVRW